VLSAFFIGMALGAWALHGRLSRSTYPAKWYAFFEAIIGIWALLLAYYLPTISAMAVTLLGDDPSPQRQWLIAFAVPAFSLLPATLAMGATLPALERWMSQYSSDGWVMGGVYAANTLGAALGVLLTAFLFAPKFGYLTTGLVMVAVNFSCASLALVLDQKRSDFQNLPHSTYESSRIGIPASNSRTILFTLFLPGCSVSDWRWSLSGS
jgi:spermidine synthase